MPRKSKTVMNPRAEHFKKMPHYLVALSFENASRKELKHKLAHY